MYSVVLCLESAAVRTSLNFTILHLQYILVHIGTYLYVPVSRLYQDVFTCTSIYLYVPVCTRLLLFNFSTRQDIVVCTRRYGYRLFRFEFEKVANRSQRHKLVIVCILSAEHTTTLQGCRPKHREDVSHVVNNICIP